MRRPPAARRPSPRSHRACAALALALAVDALVAPALAQGPAIAPPARTERAPGAERPRPARPPLPPPAIPPEKAAKPSAIVALVNDGFESTRSTTDSIDGWNVIQHAGETSYAFALDEQVRRSGERSLHIVNIGSEPYGSVYQIVPAAAYRGKPMRFAGWLRTLDAKGNRFGSGAGLQMLAMRQGIPMEGVQMRRNAVAGTTEWTRYELVMKIPPEAEQIEVGVTLYGPGSAWLDDVELAVLPQD